MVETEADGSIDSSRQRLEVRASWSSIGWT